MCKACRAPGADNNRARARVRSRALNALARRYPEAHKGLLADVRAEEPDAGRGRVRKRALGRLARHYPEAFKALLAEELAKEEDR